MHKVSAMILGGESSSVALEPFLPRLVIADPGRRVHPFQGTVLHVRLTGLHELVGALAGGGERAADEVDRFMGECLEGITGWVTRYGGDTLELDATEVTAFFPDEPELTTSVERGLACALAVRDVVLRLGDGSSHGGRLLTAALGVSAGVIHGVLLGQPAYGQRVVFTGPALAGAIRASYLAGVNQIALQPSAGARIPPEAARTSPALPTPVLARLEALVHPVGTVIPARAEAGPPIPPHFVSPGLFRLLEHGIVRPAFHKLTAMNVTVTGIDPVAAGDLEPLNVWFDRVQQLVHGYDGHILSLEVGAATQLGVIFGAPSGHSDDEARALQCASAVQRAARDVPAVSDQRLGVATGQGYAGLIGGRSRHTYSVAGPRLELSRRLAAHAGPWEVLVDRFTVSRAGFGFDWGPPPSMQTGGDVDLVTSRVLYGEGAYGTKLTSRSRGSLVGREPMMSALQEEADQAIAGRGRMAVLIGQAGIGKSAMLVWLGQFLQQTRRIPVYRGECSALVRQAPYHAWIPVFREWLDLQPDLPADELRARIEQRVASLGEDLVARASLLAMVTGVEFPEHVSTQGLESSRRRDAMYALVLELFRRAHQHSPLGLIFEDAHWMDDASLGLLRYLARNIGDRPIFITVTRRPVDEVEAAALVGLDSIVGAKTFNLGALPAEALSTLACRHIGATSLAPELEHLLVTRSSGTPLFLEELTLLLRDTDQVQVDRDGVAHLVEEGSSGLPYDLRDVILSRMARLDEGAQLTLKAASAIGRNFSLSLLQEIYPVPFELSVLLARLERVEGLDIVRRDDGAEVQGASTGHSQGAGHPGSQELRDDSVFFFKHAIIRDTVYETLTSATRRSLHESIGLALERRLTPENRSELVLALAEHFRRTLRTDKQRLYYREAGEIARARALNREAFGFLQAAEHLSQLIGDHEGVADLLESEVSVLNLLGDREAQREAINRWKETAREYKDERRLADALRAEGNLLVRLGEPYKALKVLERARRMARAREDALQEARVLRIICRTHFQQGDLVQALEYAEEALSLTASLSIWQEVNSDETNVGTILNHMNRIGEGRVRLEKALMRSLEMGDIRIAGIALSNLGVLDFQGGHYDQALQRWERALQLKRQVGERNEEGVTLNNIALIWMSIGGFQKARTLAVEALNIARQVEDRWAEANICVNLGAIYVGLGEETGARGYFARAGELAEQCGARHTQAEALEGLAKLELSLGRIEAAAEAIQQALPLGEQRRVPMLSLAALIDHLRGRQEEAERQAAEAIKGLPAFEASGEPGYLVRFNLARVLEESDPESARSFLAESREELLRRASRIDDPDLRLGMLEAVPENRLIQQSLMDLNEFGPGRTGEQA